MRLVLLTIDAAINLVLGVILVFWPRSIAAALGIPPIEHPFYPSILGAVLVGIGIALLVECLRRNDASVGLGLAGAVSINLSAGVVLAYWLLAGDLSMPLRGWMILCSLTVLLVGISSAELISCLRRRTGK